MFSCEYFKTLQNSFFTEHLWTATSVLGKNLESFTISYDLAKYLKSLTIVIDFAENIWNFVVAIKQSENPIKSMIQHSFGEFFPWNTFHKWVKFPKEAWGVWYERLNVFASSLIIKKVCNSQAEISHTFMEMFLNSIYFTEFYFIEILTSLFWLFSTLNFSLTRLY